MRIHKINNNIELLTFSQDRGLDINITLIYINPKEVLMIDAGYFKQGLVVKKYLDQNNIELKEILLSHYHPDHAAGINAFNDPKISASHLYASNYNNCTHKWDKDHDYKKPTSLIYNLDERNEEGLHLKFYEAPGHSACSLLIQINKGVLHIGDLMMRSPKGKPTLPYLTPGGGFEEHIESLQKIKNLQPKCLIISHGDPIVGKEAIDLALNKRIHYLETMLTTQGKCSLEEALAGNIDDWAYKGWHRYNLKYI